MSIYFQYPTINEYPDLANSLKTEKIEVNNKDNEGRTPLILYSVLGLSACINKLLDHGADYELIDNHSDTFLHKLCNNGYLNIVQNIIRKVTSIIDTKNDS